ncbi:MAG: tetratricopeptide repeat protein, partial [Candidatus Kapaibacteriota bacterium]
NLRLGYYEEAVENFVKIIEKNPDSSAAFTLLGDAYLYIGKKYEAKLAYRKALEIDPLDRKAQRQLELLDEFKDVTF